VFIHEGFPIYRFGGSQELHKVTFFTNLMKKTGFRRVKDKLAVDFEIKDL
jgi:hypothetical protein